MNSGLDAIRSAVIKCRACPRLVSWREQVAQEKVRRFADEDYWGKPVPGFGAHNPGLLIVGLAPAAHGANRTGRMFTGDRSGDWLYRSLHKFGFATQPQSVNRDDGLLLDNCYITAALRCAPPQNKPTGTERQNCLPFLERELAVLPELKVVLALGKLAFDTVTKLLKTNEMWLAATTPAFAHGAEFKANERLTLLASYHPSQQNTFTGKLTESMFDSVFRRARQLVDD